MIRRPGLLLLLALAGCGDAAPQENDAGAADAVPTDASPVTNRFAVMSWNLEQFPKTSRTADRVIEILEAFPVDVVGVQEISDASAFEDLVASLPGYQGLQVDDPGAFLRVGMLYRADRVQVTDEEVLFREDPWAFPRPPLKARVTASAEDRTFDFVLVVVHLKAQIDEESESRRREACETLEVWVGEQLQAGGERDVMIVGDFNDDPTDVPDDNVFLRFLERPQQYALLTLPLAQQGAFSYITYEAMIDHILVTTDALDEYGAGATRVLDLELSNPTYEALVSDHRPVVSWFELP